MLATLHFLHICPRKVAYGGRGFFIAGIRRRRLLHHLPSLITYRLAMAAAALRSPAAMKGASDCGGVRIVYMRDMCVEWGGKVDWGERRQEASSAMTTDGIRQTSPATYPRRPPRLHSTQRLHLLYTC